MLWFQCTSVTCLLTLQSITYVLLEELPPWGNNLHPNPILQLLNILIFFLVFQNKLAKIFKVACESRQFRNPELFKCLITLKFADLHMEDHMV